jgi:anhydro-N-acetylmuramic acid kinase
MTVPYEETMRQKIRAVLGLHPDTPENQHLLNEVERELTLFWAQAVKDYIETYGVQIDVIGLEGHTVYNNPQEHFIYQLGDGELLAQQIGVKVVYNFHAADIAAGGQGAPLDVTYYNAITSQQERSLAVVDISGISSIAWLGSYGEMVAFNSGPGNAAIDEWVMKHASMHMDYNGKLAVMGHINEQILAALMKHKYFAKYPPKSTHREEFKEKLEHLEGLSLEDGAATATAFVAESIAYSLLLYVPEIPKRIMVCGGGAKNPTLMRFLRQRLPNIEVCTAEDWGYNSLAIGVQAVAYQAVRRLHCLPISFPTTTGVYEPMVGGKIVG